MTASTSRVKDELRVVIPKTGDEVEVLENGGISPNLSVRTDDDACSEIIRIEQDAAHDETSNTTALGRIVRTMQVSQFQCNN